MNSHEVFIHIHQGCFAGIGAIVRLPQCQWSKPDGYGKISQCITTTKHSKARTVCIFLGIYCISRFSWRHTSSLEGKLRIGGGLSFSFNYADFGVVPLYCQPSYHQIYDKSNFICTNVPRRRPAMSQRRRNDVWSHLIFLLFSVERYRLIVPQWTPVGAYPVCVVVVSTLTKCRPPQPWMPYCYPDSLCYARVENSFSLLGRYVLIVSTFCLSRFIYFIFVSTSGIDFKSTY